jgi:hypothetical protein
VKGRIFNTAGSIEWHDDRAVMNWNLEGSSSNVNEILSWHLPERTEKAMKNLSKDGQYHRRL